MKAEHLLSESQFHPVASMQSHKKTNQPTLANIPEFVKKLFSMLEENAYPTILSWGLDGKTFVVIEPTEFSKLILPKHFKHGNFASFVRQLNKYDFHKIRHQNDDWPFGHQAWEFRHSHFQYQRKELLRGIKRKSTNHANTKTTSSSSSSIPQISASSAVFPSPFVLSPLYTSTTVEKSMEEIRTLTQQINEIQQSHSALTKKLRSLAQNHHWVVETISTFKKTMLGQDNCIQNIAQIKNKEFDSDANQIIQSYHSASVQELNKLELIMNYVKKQEQQISSFVLSDQETMLEPPPSPILVPPTVLSISDHSTTRWATNPRILLAVSSINNGKIIRDQLFQWLQCFGCVIESILIDPLVDPFDISGRFDMYFVDESILSRNLSVLTVMRQNNPWAPLICLCEVILDQIFIDWIKQGVTDILARPFEQQSTYKMVNKYCSHLKLS